VGVCLAGAIAISIDEKEKRDSITKDSEGLIYLGKVVSSGPLYSKSEFRGTTMKLDNGEFISIIKILDFVSPGVKVSRKIGSENIIYCLDNEINFQCYYQGEQPIEAF
jgi:hypothetical protein